MIPQIHTCIVLLVSDIDISSFISSGFLTPTANKRCQGKKVTVNGKMLALFYYNDQFYAVDERCPHMGEHVSYYCPLYLGVLISECPDNITFVCFSSPEIRTPR